MLNKTSYKSNRTAKKLISQTNQETEQNKQIEVLKLIKNLMAVIFFMHKTVECSR